MPDEKRGLKRPKAPVDLFTLQPEPDLVPGTEELETPPASKPRKRSKPRATSAKRRSPSKTESSIGLPRAERIKTSVELLPETIDLIEQIKSQHRREHRRHLPMWKILDEAVRQLAERMLKQ